MNIKVTLASSITILVLFLFPFSNTSHAQTIYKDDPGVFASLESFYLRGGSIENAQLIGPAFGYRFNDTYDVSMHTELLFSEVQFNSTDSGETSLLNLGLVLGKTTRLAEQWMVRSEISLYKSFNFNVSGFPDQIEDPSLNSALTSSAIYARLPVSDTFILLPNAGGFLGYGDYESPVTDAGLTQAFEGFVAGPELGLDFLFDFSDNFSFALQPTFRSYFTSENDLRSQVIVDFQFNF
jgi:hypothetical protein